MKKLLKLALMIGLATWMTGCASPYMMDRRNDIADIFTLSGGSGAGAKARVGPFQTGLLFEKSAAGLRGGVHFDHANNRDTFIFPEMADLQLIIVGFESCQLRDPIARERNKDFEMAATLCGVTIYEEDDLGIRYYTQIEAVIALGASVRLGFNPGELLDFVLGWATIDLFKDDLYARPTFTRYMYDIQKNPEALHNLVEQLRTRQPTVQEVDVLADMIRKPNCFRADEVPLLLDLMQSSQDNVEWILRQQEVPIDQFQKLYDRYKEKDQSNRVLYFLASDPRVPMDIVRALLGSKDHYVAERAKKRVSE